MKQRGLFGELSQDTNYYAAESDDEIGEMS